MATILLYNNTSYLKSFDATVISCTPCTYNKKDVYDVVLDKSCFFPEQGGQDSDTGILKAASEAIKVLHVSIKDEVLHHICDNRISEGVEVYGEIDWDKRYDKMQQHSGEHLVSGTVHKLFGYDNVGFHLGDNDVTLDFNGLFEESDIDSIETIVNRAIYENFESKCYFPSKEELDVLEYRSKKELLGSIRIVEFPGYDICACCAPHVLRTGEIGIIKIISAEHFKGGTRMYIKCGNRALTEFRSLLNDARSISRLTSAKINEIAPAVSKMSEALKNEKFTRIAIERKYLEACVQQLISDSTPILFVEKADSDNLRYIVNYMISQNTGYCCAFMGNDNDGYRFIIASAQKDCRELVNSLKNSFAIKGGGSADMVQGTICGTADNIKNDICSFTAKL